MPCAGRIIRMKIGILAVQGAVSEHIEMINIVLGNLGTSGCAVPVRSIADMKPVSALIIPGGESTTISKAIVNSGLHDEIIKRARDGMPIMGTCAGCVLLAKEGDDDVRQTSTKLLSLVNMAVDRNAFGRQRESFETELDIRGIGKFHAVFIRAPHIRRIWDNCKSLATVREDTTDIVVMAQQDNIIAVTFHPELTKDTRIHEMFVGMV
jgi:5'-phosphate synthase pdxT subunit